MDSINPDSRFNYTPRDETKSPPSTNESSHPKLQASAPREPFKPVYSKMFDDTELERLQNNLQSIADMAGKALDRIKK
jgi:hypothetical protein